MYENPCHFLRSRNVVFDGQAQIPGREEAGLRNRSDESRCGKLSAAYLPFAKLLLWPGAQFHTKSAIQYCHFAFLVNRIIARLAHGVVRHSTFRLLTRMGYIAMLLRAWFGKMQNNCKVV